MNDLHDLEAALLRAHELGDAAQLVKLYRQAGELALAEDDVLRGCFFLTHAYVFALEAGLPEAQNLRGVLIQYGRES